jgi:membrane associated rhomboid family serine protease
MVLSVFAAIASVATVIVLSRWIERRFGRSCSHPQKASFYISLLVLSIGAIFLVPLILDLKSVYSAAAFGLAAGLGALVSQLFFGRMLPTSDVKS